MDIAAPLVSHREAAIRSGLEDMLGRGLRDPLSAWLYQETAGQPL